MWRLECHVYPSILASFRHDENHDRLLNHLSPPCLGKTLPFIRLPGLLIDSIAAIASAFKCMVRASSFLDFDSSIAFRSK